MSRMIIRIGLGISFALAIVIAFFVIASFGLQSTETWVIIAAVLAVLTSILSTWSSQRVLELEEDAKEADICFEFDLYSRYSLVQFRVKNVGGTTAFDIKFNLDRPLLRQQDNELKFGTNEIGSEIPVLNAGDSAAQAIGTSLWFFQNNENTTFAGEVKYKNVSGKTRKKNFTVSAEQFRASLVHETETTKAFRDIQDIPVILREISRKLDR